MNWKQLSAVASALIVVPGAAQAQAPAPAAQEPAAKGPALSVGTVIYDPQGGEVGKVESMTGDAVVIDTGSHKATLPKTAFGSGAKGPSITVTKAQIDAQVQAAADKASAELDALLVPGAEVRGKSGALVGTVKGVNGPQVVIDRASGPVSLTKAAFASTPNGVVISLTTAELDAAAKAAVPKP